MRWSAGKGGGLALLTLHTWLHISAIGHLPDLDIFYPQKEWTAGGLFIQVSPLAWDTTQLSWQQLPISRASWVWRGWPWTAFPGKSLPKGAREPQDGSQGQISIQYIGVGFFNITTAFIILHTNPIPGTNLLSQSSYFSPVHILTSIKFSVCPKLTNTARCFIQRRRSINKAQLLSLSAFLHFRITVSYVDAGASNADGPAPRAEVCSRIPCAPAASGMGQKWGFPIISRDPWKKVESSAHLGGDANMNGIFLLGCGFLLIFSLFSHSRMNVQLKDNQSQWHFQSVQSVYRLLF